MTKDLFKQRILIIDDTPVQLLVIGRILSSLYDVVLATTGEEGLKLAKEHNVDLILLDLYMLDISGFEVLKRLKTSPETMHIPVIFITSSSSNEDEAEGLAIGAVDYIRKPFTEVIVRLRVEIQLRLISQMKVIENVSVSDWLTGVSNRHNFFSKARSVWDTASQAKDGFSLLLVDIDEMGRFNDTYGQNNGDAGIKAVAYAIQNTVEKENDSIYRWGSDEFMIIMPGADINKALDTAKRIRESTAAAPIGLEEGAGERASLTVSTAAGSVNPAGMDFDAAFGGFLTNLNRALYRTKTNGPNRSERI